MNTGSVIRVDEWKKRGEANKHISGGEATMSSVQGLREFVSERLTSAADEIFRVIEQTVVVYEKEIVRQRRLLDMVLKPELKLHRTSEYKHNGLQETNTKEVVFFTLSVCEFAGFSKNYWWLGVQRLVDVVDKNSHRRMYRRRIVVYVIARVFRAVQLN